MFKTRENLFLGVLKIHFAHCAFHKLKKRKNRIKPCCDSIENAFLRLFNQLQKYRVLYYFPYDSFHYLLFASQLQSNF